jgi:hypothetical protein
MEKHAAVEAPAQRVGEGTEAFEVTAGRGRSRLDIDADHPAPPILEHPVHLCAARVAVVHELEPLGGGSDLLEHISPTRWAICAQANAGRCAPV